MERLCPQLLLSLKEYSGAKFTKDLIAGVIVAIIALPLSIALALASGVSPEQGLYTAIEEFVACIGTASGYAVLVGCVALAIQIV